MTTTIYTCLNCPKRVVWLPHLGFWVHADSGVEDCDDTRATGAFPKDTRLCTARAPHGWGIDGKPPMCGGPADGHLTHAARNYAARREPIEWMSPTPHGHPDDNPTGQPDTTTEPAGETLR